MRTLQILIVDDERATKFLFEQRWRKYIRNGLYQVSFAFSLREGIACLAEVKFDLLLLDLWLGDGQGFDLMVDANAHQRLPPTIIMTAYDDAARRLLAMQLGAQSWINKPVDFRQLHTVMQTTLATVEIDLPPQTQRWFEQPLR